MTLTASTQPLAPANQREVLAMTRMLRRSCGTFVLAFARLNIPAIRPELVAVVREMLAAETLTLTEVTLSGRDADILEELTAAPEPGQPLFVYGLEHVLISTEPYRAFGQLNEQRGRYQQLARPVVLWAPDHVLSLLATHAPDFWDWRSGVYAFGAERSAESVRALPESPGGAVPLPSAFYVERLADRQARQALRRHDTTLVIHGPRQSGKSSLLVRLMQEARQAGRYVACLDMTVFGRAVLKNADAFFRQFCSHLTDVLYLSEHRDEYWNPKLGNAFCCTRYIERHVLPTLDRPLLLMLDEVDVLLTTDWHSDFFSMLRSWHNHRALHPAWRQLGLVLAMSAEPWQLIDNLDVSPFNIGLSIHLTDFTTAELADLNRRHGSPLSTVMEQELITWLGGHPYLIRQALYLVASGHVIATELLAQATDDYGPFGEHLRAYWPQLYREPELMQALLQVLNSSPVEDPKHLARLSSLGLIRHEGRRVLPRCRLYAEYFRERLES